jgi:hypothetical protein
VGFVPGRLLPAGLVLAATVADGGGRHDAAFYLLLLAVPAAAAAALREYGELVVARGALTRCHAVLSGLTLLFAVLAAAVRAGAAEPPPVAFTALGACITVIVLQGLVTLLVLAQPTPRRRYASTGSRLPLTSTAPSDSTSARSRIAA